MPENERISHYQAVISDLVAQRGELLAQLEEIDSAIRLVGRRAGIEQPAELSAEAPAAAPLAHGEATGEIFRSDSFFGMGIGEAAKKFLGFTRKPRTLSDIAAGLREGGLLHQSKNFSATLHTALTRRAKIQGDVVKVKRGQWSLAEWYPTMRKSQD